MVTGSISAAAPLNATGEEDPGAARGSATTSNSVKMNSPSELRLDPPWGRLGSVRVSRRMAVIPSTWVSVTTT